MKPTAKIIPIDQRRRRALERAHAHEVRAAWAAVRHREAGYEPQSLDWAESNDPPQRLPAPELGPIIPFMRTQEEKR